MSQHASLNEALIACITAAGGSKIVGPILFPEKNPVLAAQYLRTCLNEGRKERLTPDQVVLIARLGRKAGCHAYMEYLAEDLAYAPPQPIEPRDEQDELRRQILAMGTQLQQALDRLNSLQAPAGAPLAVVRGAR